MGTLKAAIIAATELARAVTAFIGWYVDNADQRDEDRLKYLLDHPTADNLAESFVVSERIKRRRAKSERPV